MAAMMIALIWLGLYPQPVLDLAQPVLDGLQQLVPAANTVAGLESHSTMAAGGAL